MDSSNCTEVQDEIMEMGMQIMNGNRGGNWRTVHIETSKEMVWLSVEELGNTTMDLLNLGTK